jgi:hypothetical protein
LRLVGLYFNPAEEDCCRWNFILSNGEESKLKCDKVMTKHLLPDIKIRKVIIRYTDGEYASLEGL